MLPGVRLYSETVFVRRDDSFTAERKTCHLLGRKYLNSNPALMMRIYSFIEKGVVGIFGPRSPFTSEHVRSIADNMDIPFIETRPNYNLGKGIHMTMLLLMRIP